jgi:ABC-type branched-subunit amino acid transport system ATPase component
VSTALAELSDITRRFRGVTALHGVSLRVDAGEAVGIIGPNGSGKTTLLNILSGVLRPHGGSVRIGGHEAAGAPAHRVAALGVGRTFQQIRLVGGMTVRQNVEFGAIARRLGREGTDAADDLLAHLGLEAHGDRLAGTLDYGSQRRLEIARALAGRPRLLLLDEPAAGMNETESDDLLDAITAARERFGCSVLIVEHDLRLIMRLCQRIHVLAEGQTLCEGTPAEVQRDQRVIDAYLGVASTATPADHQAEEGQ